MPDIPEAVLSKIPAAVRSGRQGGLKGGRARAGKLTPEQRSEIARKGAQGRWGAVAGTGTGTAPAWACLASLALLGGEGLPSPPAGYDSRMLVATWLAPALGVVLAAIGGRWFGWFQPKSRRRIALRRIAERLAFEDSAGYDHKRERYLEHYLGGRPWDEEWEKSDTPDGKGGTFDSRGPALNWRQRLARRLA